MLIVMDNIRPQYGHSTATVRPFNQVSIYQRECVHIRTLPLVRTQEPMYITVNICMYNTMCTYKRYHSDGNPMRISVFVIEVVRTLDVMYNVRCSVRTVLVRSRNNYCGYFWNLL